MPELKLPDVTLFYEQRGEGPDIFWLAGGDQPGSDWHLWQTPAFPEFRHTTYDARGVGRTVSHNPPPWPMALYGEDCRRVDRGRLRRAGLPRRALDGLAHRTAGLPRPSRPGPLGRAHGHVRAGDRLRARVGGGGSRVPAPGRPAEPALRDDALRRLHVPDRRPGRRRALGEAQAVRRARLRGAGRRRLAAQWEACVEFDSLDRLPGCRVPLHVIAFSHDVQTPPVRGKLVADTVPDGHFHLLEGLGHCSAFGHKPDVVNACIRAIVVADA